MKRFMAMFFVISFVLGLSAYALAQDEKFLEEKEKEVWKKACSAIPKERHINLEQFKRIYDDVVAGKLKAYIVDTRTHPEFYAFHIPYTDHIHAGHMYTFPDRVKDKNAMIVVFCRTHKRQCYVGEKLAEYGYTNVWLYEDGIVGWIKAGYPVCNQFAGIFKVTEYYKEFTETDKETKKPLWRVREFHPY